MVFISWKKILGFRRGKEKKKTVLYNDGITQAPSRKKYF